MTGLGDACQGGDLKAVVCTQTSVSQGSATRRGAGRRRLRLAVAIAWCLLPAGIPAIADDKLAAWSEVAIREHVDISDYAGTLSIEKLKRLIGIGKSLFTAKFTSLDGVGRPMATQAIIPTKRKRPVDATFRRTAGLDANACSSCHNVPVIGGAGDFTVNVFVSEGFESADFDSLDPQFSDERGTNSLFGAGLKELLAREMTSDLREERSEAAAEAHRTGHSVTVALTTKGVEFGQLTIGPDGMVDNSAVSGVDPDLVVRPFSRKGVFTSIRQFTINALNVHHGMEAAERFGARWTGTNDFSGDGHPDKITAGDVSALVAFQTSLPAPERMVPDDPSWQEAAGRGEKTFNDLGCAGCHKPALPLKSLAFTDPAPYDMAGTLRTGEVANAAVYDLSLLDWAKKLPRNDQGEVMVPLFSDLKRHRIADDEVNQLGNELLAQRFVERDVFLTSPLWGVGSTAPYGHRKDITTLDEVIRAHGGEGRAARDAYIAESDADRSSLIAYLKTLVIKP